MFLLLSSVFCDGAPDTSAAASTSSPLGMTTLVLLLLDVAFLFYMLVTQREDLKNRQTYIFLAHGSFFFLAFNINNFNKGPLYILMVCIVILIAYYFLCTIPIAVTIITVINITVLFPIMNSIFLAPIIGNGPGAAVGGTLGLIIAIVLAVFYPDFLLKVHNLFVVYIYSALLVSLIGLTPLLPSGGDAKPNPLNMVSAIVLFAVIGVLIFMK